jgi:hypothetical protein
MVQSDIGKIGWHHAFPQRKIGATGICLCRLVKTTSDADLWLSDSPVRKIMMHRCLLFIIFCPHYTAEIMSVTTENRASRHS